MNNKSLWAGIVAVAVVLIVWWMVTYKKDAPSNVAGGSPSNGNQIGDVQAESQPSDNQMPQQSTGAPDAAVASASKVSKEVRLYVEKVMADPEYDWKRPINFYGRVVDEAGAPVVDADIHFSWSALSESGTSKANTKSDAAGSFSLTGKMGKGLSVSVRKQGYFTPASERLRSFEYANPADGLFVPDSTKPVVFHLRKKGAGVYLITSEHGVHSDFRVTAPLDGKEVHVNLLERKAGAQGGHLIISQSKPPSKSWKQAEAWSFQMTIPDGGFVEYPNQDFPFEAPETGYEPTVKFEFQKDQTNWVTSVSKDYFIRFGTPPLYGRLHLETQISGTGARFTYAINTNAGSRYLEHDESLKPKQTVFE